MVTVSIRNVANIFESYLRHEIELIIHCYKTFHISSNATNLLKANKIILQDKTEFKILGRYEMRSMICIQSHVIGIKISFHNFTNLNALQYSYEHIIHILKIIHFSLIRH